jgi:hypothetical protein
MIEIPKDVFEQAAYDADFEEIKTGYNGRGYATNCTALVGSDDQIRKFFARLGAASMEDDAGFDMYAVDRLADGMGSDNMGRTDLVFYWGERVLTLTEA